MTHITTVARRHIAEKHTEFVEKQILAAWRAGYDFLYVTAYSEEPRRGAYFPSNRDIDMEKELFYRRQYDLRDLTIDDFGHS